MGMVDENNAVSTPPEKIASKAAYIFQHRRATGPFEIAVDGVTKAGERGLVREYEQAGATWWFEILHLLRGTPEELLQCIQAGPPN